MGLGEREEGILRLCVCQFKAEGLRDDLFAGTPDTFFIEYLLAKSCELVLVVDLSVAIMHARTDENLFVKVLSGIKCSRFWRLKVAVNGTRKASKHCQEYSSGKAGDKYAFPTERQQSVYLQEFL